MRIEKVTQAFNVELEWKMFPLHPETPPEGQSLEALFAGRAYDPEESYQRMKGLMDEEGLPYARRSHTYNSRMAQELAKWADTIPGFQTLHDALYRAYFVDNANIGELEVLLGIAGSVGRDRNEARAVLEERRFKAEVDADWLKSRQYGVTGVPTFVSNMQGVVGAQPYEVLVQLMEQAGVERRA